MFERTIWAPDGTSFRLRLVPNPDARSEEKILGDAGFLRYDVTGPRDERHLWIFDQFRQLVDVGHDDVPTWTVLARLAFDGWVSLDAALS